MNLFEINKEIMDLASNDELSQEELEKQFNELKMSMDEKIHNTIKYIRSLELDVSTLEAEIDRINKHKQATEKKKE